MKPITMIQAQWRAESQEGESLHFEECKGGYFSDRDEFGLKVSGRTEQRKLTGTNLIPVRFSGGTSYTANGVTFETNGDMIHAVGTATANTYFRVEGGVQAEYMMPKHLQNGETYTLTANYDVSQNTRFVMYFYGTPNGNKSIHATQKITTFTVPDSYTAYGLFLFVPIGETVNGDYRAYINKGSTSLPYEPYCGGIPSPNPEYPQEIQCVKVGTKVRCTTSDSEITTPCDLYEGDIWYPMSGKVERNNYVKTFRGTEIFNDYSSVDVVAFYINTLCKCTAEYKPYFRGNKLNNLYYSNGKGDYIGIKKSTNGFAGKTTEEIKQQIKDWYDAGDPLKIVYPLATPVIESYPPQPIYANPGTVHVMQIPTDLKGTLSATMLVRR